MQVIPRSRKERTIAGTAKKIGGLTSPTLVLSGTTNSSDSSGRHPSSNSILPPTHTSFDWSTQHNHSGGWIKGASLDSVEDPYN